MSWYFISRVLKLASVEMYVWSGYDGASETVKAHCTEMLNYHRDIYIGIGTLFPADRLFKA